MGAISSAAGALRLGRHMIGGTRDGALLRRTQPQIFLLSGLRVAALAVAAIQLWAFPHYPDYVLPPVTFLAIAAVYTGLKLAQPINWHRSKLPNVGLFALDLSVCFFLVMLTGPIQSPFLLYTVSPVLTAALIMPYKVTLIIASASSAYVLAGFLIEAPIDLGEQVAQMNDLPFYLMSLWLTATLPYLINSRANSQLQYDAIIGERHRLAREIHDGLCQEVYGLRWWIKMLRRDFVNTERLMEDLASLEKLTEEAEEGVRGSIELLRNFKGDLPFISQVEGYLKQLERDMGIDARLESPLAEPNLDKLVKLELLSICEEALRNVAKHSQASHIVVRVRGGNGNLQVNIADDGRGFDLAKQAGGHGLTVMKERAELIGGKLQVCSAPGEGTAIQVEVRDAGL